MAINLQEEELTFLRKRKAVNKKPFGWEGGVWGEALWRH